MIHQFFANLDMFLIINFKSSGVCVLSDHSKNVNIPQVHRRRERFGANLVEPESQESVWSALPQPTPIPPFSLTSSRGRKLAWEALQDTSLLFLCFAAAVSAPPQAQHNLSALSPLSPSSNQSPSSPILDRPLGGGGAGVLRHRHALQRQHRLDRGAILAKRSGAATGNGGRGMHGRLPFPMAQTALARSDGARKRLRPRVDARARVCSVLLWGPGSGDPVGGGGGGWGYGGQQPRQGEPGEPSYNICVYIYIIYIRRDDIYIYIYI